MKYIDDHCSEVSELKECAAEGMKKNGIDSAKVETVFAKSFKENEDNTYLKKSRDVLANAGVTKFPTVTINNVKVKGSLNVALISLRQSSFSTMSVIPSPFLPPPVLNTSNPKLPT